MNKLGILIKNYLLLAWGEIKYKKKKGGRNIGSLALIVVLGAFLIFAVMSETYADFRNSTQISGQMV